MITSIVGSLILLIFTLLVHRGPYPIQAAEAQRPGRDAVESALLAVCLLAVPFIELDLLWFSGWLGGYFVVGLVTPILFEWILRRRSFSGIGFRMPENRRVLVIVAIIMGIYLASRLAQPGFFFEFDWRRFWSNSVIFALIEETI